MANKITYKEISKKLEIPFQVLADYMSKIGINSFDDNDIPHNKILHKIFDHFNQFIVIRKTNKSYKASKTNKTYTRVISVKRFDFELLLNYGINLILPEHFHELDHKLESIKFCEDQSYLLSLLGNNKLFKSLIIFKNHNEIKIKDICKIRVDYSFSLNNYHSIFDPSFATKLDNISENNRLINEREVLKKKLNHYVVTGFFKDFTKEFLEDSLNGIYQNRKVQLRQYILRNYNSDIAIITRHYDLYKIGDILIKKHDSSYFPYIGKGKEKEQKAKTTIHNSSILKERKIITNATKSELIRLANYFKNIGKNNDIVNKIEKNKIEIEEAKRQIIKKIETEKYVEKVLKEGQEIPDNKKDHNPIHTRSFVKRHFHGVDDDDERSDGGLEIIKLLSHPESSIEMKSYKKYLMDKIVDFISDLTSKKYNCNRNFLRDIKGLLIDIWKMLEEKEFEGHPLKYMNDDNWTRNLDDKVDKLWKLGKFNRGNSLIKSINDQYNKIEKKNRILKDLEINPVITDVEGKKNGWNDGFPWESTYTKGVINAINYVFQNNLKHSNYDGKDLNEKNIKKSKISISLNNVALTKDKKNKQQYVYELKIVDEESIKKTDLSDIEEEEFIKKIRGSLKLDLKHVVDLRLEFNIGKQKTPKTIEIFDSEGVNDLYHKYEKSKDIKGFTYIFTFYR